MMQNWSSLHRRRERDRHHTEKGNLPAVLATARERKAERSHILGEQKARHGSGGWGPLAGFSCLLRTISRLDCVSARASRHRRRRRGGCFPEMKRDGGRDGVRAECEREGHNQVLFGSGRGHQDHRPPQTSMGETRNMPRACDRMFSGHRQTLPRRAHFF